MKLILRFLLDITSACERVSIMGALDIIGRIHSTRGSDSEDAVDTRLLVDITSARERVSIMRALYI